MVWLIITQKTNLQYLLTGAQYTVDGFIKCGKEKIPLLERKERLGK